MAYPGHPYTYRVYIDSMIIYHPILCFRFIMETHQNLDVRIDWIDQNYYSVHCFVGRVKNPSCTDQLFEPEYHRSMLNFNFRMNVELNEEQEYNVIRRNQHSVDCYDQQNEKEVNSLLCITHIQSTVYIS